MENEQEFMKLVEQIVCSEGGNQKDSKNDSEGNFILTRIVTTVTNLFVKFAIKTVIGYRKVIGRWRTRAFPAACVMSLSREQIFHGKSRESLLSFFREPRFEIPTGEILIETKSFRSFQIKFSSFKISIPIYFYLNTLSNAQRKEVLNLYNIAVKSWMRTSNSKWQADLKKIYFIFELAVWFTIKAERIALITTQSTMNNLPTAFQIENSSFNRKMFWYSTNMQPITKQGLTPKKEIFSRSLDRSIDMHYVWDLSSKQFLSSGGITRVKTVGSILFIKPEPVNLENTDFNIAFFDVTPFEQADTYYTTERMCANLLKIVEISSQLSIKVNLKINLLVKPKRVFHEGHSRAYIQMLYKFEKEGKLQILKPEVNIYGIASSVNCIIGIPFTSPVVVGRELKTPSVYFDTHKDNYQLPLTSNGFQVISDEAQFISWLEECLLHHSTGRKYFS